MPRPQFKVSRRIGENIWFHKKTTPKQTAILKRLRKNPKRRRSDFWTQLHHRTKLSLFYGNVAIRKIQQNKIHKCFNKQSSLLSLLETRLDVVLTRASFCSTVFTARQLISHGKVIVNSRVVNVSSSHINIGDIIYISKQHRESTKAMIRARLVSNQISKFKTGTHLEVNYKLLIAVLLHEPSIIQFPYQVELHQI